MLNYFESTTQNVVLSKTPKKKVTGRKGDIFKKKKSPSFSIKAKDKVEKDLKKTAYTRTY